MSILTWAATDELTLDGGVNLEHQDNNYRRLRYSYSIPANFDVTPARIQNDDRYTLDNVGAYVQPSSRRPTRGRSFPLPRGPFSGTTTTTAAT